MNIIKALIITILFITGLELLSFWSFLFVFSKSISEFVFTHYILIEGLLEFGIVLFVMYKIYGWKKLIPNDAPLYYILIAALLGISIVYLEVFVEDVLNAFLKPENRLPGGKEISLKAMFEHYQWGWLIFIPLAEELIFRRYIQHELQKTYEATKAILITAVLFGLTYLPFYGLLSNAIPFDVYPAVFALFGGVLAGLLYYKSKSILPAIIFHVVWNFVAGGVVFVWE